MNSPLTITSDTILDDFNTSFRVFAGPGAGKTYWLINHIKNVIHNSDLLNSTSKIACISYTNIAADEIVNRLGQSAEHVEVSTIHSFLYRYVVKPYLHLISDEYNNPLVDYINVDGHDEHHPSYSLVKQWLGQKNEYILNRNKTNLFQYLKNIAWQYDLDSLQWKLKTPKYKLDNMPKSKLEQSELEQYKLLYWQQGILGHDDVLYFAYRILNEHSILRSFLKAKFPYVFVDEFQDTSPVQTVLLKWLAEEGAIVGVIGDIEQAIYGFQGAKSEHFQNFTIQELVDYEIPGNRRSTNAIIMLLNHIRQDKHVQKGLRQLNGKQVVACIGNHSQVIICTRKRLSHITPVTTLTRRNKEADILRRQGKERNIDVWEEFEKSDSKGHRLHLFKCIVEACELAKESSLSIAIDTMRKGIRIEKDRLLYKPLKSTSHVSENQRCGLAVTLECAKLMYTLHTITWLNSMEDSYERKACIFC